ncbi:Annexin [Dictyocaulus viviparus]|uniref:Annexin n=1 Tax=Dictyocaulus viviparus TaxID=29172 RepID=A0A0D8X6H4_DICVI|nr:Annexin [Dictyocaulus viviparus]
MCSSVDDDRTEQAKILCSSNPRRNQGIFQGIGIRDKDLIRLVSRAQIDLAAIQVEYERLFKKSLLQVIREECKGANRALLGIFKGNKSLN